MPCLRHHLVPRPLAHAMQRQTKPLAPARHGTCRLCTRWRHSITTHRLNELRPQGSLDTLTMASATTGMSADFLPKWRGLVGA